MGRWRCVIEGGDGWEALCARVDAALPRTARRGARERSWSSGAWPFASRHEEREVIWALDGLRVRASSTRAANHGAMTDDQELLVEAEGDEGELARFVAALTREPPR
jgi:hypothetical protein